MSATTITETCPCGATFTTTSDPINAAMNAKEFRKAHEVCLRPREPLAGDGFYSEFVASEQEETRHAS